MILTQGQKNLESHIFILIRCLISLKYDLVCSNQMNIEHEPYSVSEIVVRHNSPENENQ
jgi:hypothetical protein